MIMIFSPACTVRLEIWAWIFASSRNGKMRFFDKIFRNFKLQQLFFYLSYESDQGMKNVLFFMNFLKNNIVLPRKATKATKTTVEVTLPKSSRIAILGCDTFIGCQGLVTCIMRPKTCKFIHFLEIVSERFLIYCFKRILKKVIFSRFCAFFAL